MKIRHIAVLALLLSAASLAQAQFPVITGIEGKITAPIVSNGAGGATITIMGNVQVNVPPGTPISSPSRTNLTVADLLNQAVFPGRTLPGFQGGTAIVDGLTSDVSGVVLATNVFVEPAENVLIGAVTGFTTEGNILINNLPCVAGTDSRIPASPPTNDSGFVIPVTAASIPVGTEVNVEGYFGDDGLFYYHLLSAVGVGAPTQTLGVAISQATGRLAKFEIDVRGGYNGALPTGAITVEIRGLTAANVETSLGFATVAADPLIPGTGTFRFNSRSANPFPVNGVKAIVRQGTANGSTVGWFPVTLR